MLKIITFHLLTKRVIILSTELMTFLTKKKVLYKPNFQIDIEIISKSSEHIRKNLEVLWQIFNKVCFKELNLILIKEKSIVNFQKQKDPF